MALQISYWTASRVNPNLPGAPISGEALAVSGSSAMSGVTPANAMFVKLNAGEATRIAYAGASSTATATSAFVGGGEVVWLDAAPGWKLAGITA